MSQTATKGLPTLKMQKGCRCADCGKSATCEVTERRVQGSWTPYFLCADCVRSVLRRGEGDAFRYIRDQASLSRV